MFRIFISYRRNDGDGKVAAHMIFREVKRLLGEDSAFLDVDSRAPGFDFPTKLSLALDQSNAVLVIIGSDWLKLLQERVSHPRDWVRFEVAESLRRSGLPVVPVCLKGVSLPTQNDLPTDLRQLANRDGVVLDLYEDFESHMGRLLSDLKSSRLKPPSASNPASRSAESYIPSLPIGLSALLKKANPAAPSPTVAAVPVLAAKPHMTPVDIPLPWIGWVAASYQDPNNPGLLRFIEDNLLVFEFPPSPGKDDRKPSLSLKVDEFARTCVVVFGNRLHQPVYLEVHYTERGLFKKEIPKKITFSLVTPGRISQSAVENLESIVKCVEQVQGRKWTPSRRTM